MTYAIFLLRECDNSYLRCHRPRAPRAYSSGNKSSGHGVFSRRRTRHLEGRVESSELARFEAVVLPHLDAAYTLAREVCDIEGNCCHTLAGGRSRMSYVHAVAVRNAARLLLAAAALTGSTAAAHRAPGDPAAVSAKLSEWQVELSERTIPAGSVTFTVANVGSIPHALEVEGQGIEQETAIIQPGASTTLTLTLKPGTYEVYCPVGEDSHKKLGM